MTDLDTLVTGVPGSLVGDSLSRLTGKDIFVHILIDGFPMMITL
ncbi:hypothetical protein [Nonomuraea polychroma]|nr:hypothetical protein [Nonomuraea polychroma]